jgi:hypothetical protein
MADDDEGMKALGGRERDHAKAEPAPRGGSATEHGAHGTWDAVRKRVREAWEKRWARARSAER